LCVRSSAVDGSFVGYKGIQEGFEELWNLRGEDRQRNEGFFSGMIRGVWRACESSRNLLFPLPNPLISPVTSLLG